MYTKKTSSITLLTLLLISALTILLPIGIAHATITGTPTLGVANHDDSPPGSVVPSAFTAAVSSVKVIAGTDHVAPTATGCDGGVCAYSPSYFAISFTGVTFSGAQFYLYMSTNGFANVNTTAGDIRYAGPFSVSDLSGAGAYQVQGIGGGITGASFWIGSIAGPNHLIVGPIPVQISTAYKYIKVYDGSCGSNPAFCGGTGIAGAVQQVIVQPGIVIDVKQGPAWTPVHVSGGGFAANQMVQINASYLYASWAGVQTPVVVATSGSISTGPGYFGPVLMTIVDTKVVVNEVSCCYYPTSGFPVFITLTAVNATAGPLDEDDVPLNAAQNAAFPVMFNEWYRFFNQVSSYFSGSTIDVVPYLTSPGYGNGTAAPGTPPPPFIPGQPIDVYITGTLGIVGSNFTVSGSVTVWINGAQLGSAVPTDTTGHWMDNVTIPALASGVYEVSVLNNGVTYQFEVKVLPTLILTPNSGPIGTTVTATAYGFPANTYVSLWWNEHAFADGNAYLLINSTVASTGSYNHTITFTVPAAYGGGHDVEATTQTWPSPETDTTLEAGAGFVTEATFTITPTCSITPGTFSDNGSLVSLRCTGMIPGSSAYNSFADVCAFSCKYYVNFDNLASTQAGQGPNRGGLAANGTGFITFNFIAAGFRPGLHVLSLIGPYPPCVAESDCATITPNNLAAYVLFNVTTTGDPIADMLTSLTTSVTGLSTSLTSIQTSLTNIQSSLTSVMSSLSSITSTLSSVTSSLSSITTTLGTSTTGIQGSLTSISSGIGSIQTSLATITGDVSGLNTAISQLQSTANSIQSSAQSLTTSVSTLGTQLTGIQNSLTTMGSQLQTIGADAHTAATQSTAAATSAANAVNGNATAQTYVLVVAVLAAITLVLELAILVRKLS